MKPLLLAVSFVAATAHADDGATPRRPDLPLWELGVGAVGVSQQAYPGSDQQARRALVLPYLIYRGKLLRADGNGAGLRAVRTESFELDVSFGGSLSSGSETLRAREGMARLGTLLEAGPVARWFPNGRSARDRITVELPLRAVFEARNPGRHRGFSFEPEVGIQRRTDSGRWGYGASVGAVLGDRRLGATFYEVDAGDVRLDRPAFEARAGLIAWRLGASLSMNATPDLRLYAFGRLDSVADAANRASPLVRQTTGASYGIGLAYTLKRSATRAND
ncbi:MULTISPECIES: MipA/OmpV family protein [unclassified Roseateles]|uniref:MipA/OmpV family protein n=1 Tax=unclassified Roseateles TaxID=2626991 RepID=UPI00138F1257|nr:MULTISPECIES: MipA/OmpV family protein [unclassified Roseateles]